MGIIAESTDGTPAGAAWLRNFPEGDKPGISGPELTIAIAPSYRRQHLAKRIMACLSKKMCLPLRFIKTMAGSQMLSLAIT